MSPASDHDDFAFEPIPGLPENLPDGEQILWQGRPRWTGIARRALHVRKIMAYCLILLAWVAATGYAGGEGTSAILLSLAWPAGLVAALFAIIMGLGVWLARSTVYTITSRRVVMRFGIVLPMTVNLPFKAIARAALKRHPDGSGDIPLALAGKDRLAWLHLWPHARPWRFNRAEPMLRDLEQADEVAALLADALEAALPDGKKTIGKAPNQPARPAAPDWRPARELATA
jgi:hypothetical protein